MLLPDFLPEQPKELVSIEVIMNNALLLVASRNEAIEGAGIFQAKLVGNETGSLVARCKVKQWPSFLLFFSGIL